MRYVKILGIAVAATAALVVFLGAGAASASTICSKNNTPCSTTAEGMLGPKTVVLAQLKAGTKSVMKAGIFNIECSESTLEIETTNTGTKAVGLTAELKDLTLGICTKGSTVTVEAPVTANKSVVGLELGYTAATMNGGLIAGVGMRVEYSLLGETCFYGGATKELTVVGGSPALIKADKAKLTKLPGSGPLCANPGIWEAEYTVTSPTALYVGEG
jgi:hypothetical protein